MKVLIDVEKNCLFFENQALCDTTYNYNPDPVLKRKELDTGLKKKMNR
jgi:hypothetical protein